MKPLFTTSILTLIFLGLISFSACRNNDDDDDTNCTGNLEASWKVNGALEEVYVSYNGHTVSFLNLHFQACADPHNAIVINYIPYPPAVGS